MEKAPPFDYALIAAAIKIAIAVGTIMLTVPMLVWLERKVIADFQARVGPDRVGPFGLLQSFADGIKLVMKEGLVPAEVDRLLYFAAPFTVMIPALVVAAVVPFGGSFDWGGYRYHLVIADIPVGFLFILALTSLGVYGIVLAGWSSNNKYSLLGGLRSAAQMVSYELPMGLSVVAGLMIATWATGAGDYLFSLSLRDIVNVQDGGILNWTFFNPRFLFLGALAGTTFYIAGLAETNRAPFDLPEAETELVGGYHTEYGGLRWAMFFLGEYAAMLNVSSLFTTLFWGGWHAPYKDTLFFPEYSIGYALQGVFWFCLKIFLIIYLYIWIRSTLPRLRYDQLMKFNWKGMLPLTLANVLVIATLLTIFHPIRKSEIPAILQQQPVVTSPAPAPGGLPPGLPPGFNLGAPGGPGGGPGGMGGFPGGMPGGMGGSPGGAPGSTPPGGGR
jgi:NADH-quinone oxidoreductase subunit H